MRSFTDKRRGVDAGWSNLKPVVFGLAAVAAIFGLAPSAALAAPAPVEGSDEAQADPPPISPVAKPAVDVSVSITQFVGSFVAGDGPQSLRYGGRADVYATFDLSDRTSILAHAEIIYGKNTNSIGGNTLLPVNTAMLLPSNGDEDFDLSVSLTQKIGKAALVTIGKINLLDLAAKTPLVGGGGLEGFQNIALAAPPSGLVPPSLLGAIFSIPTKNAIFGLWIYDPVSTTNRTGFEDPFGTGAAGLASVTIPVTIGGKPGFQGLKVAVNNKRGFDLRDLPALLLPPGTVSLGEKKGGWNVTYSFQQYLWMNPDVPGVGWGVFGQIGKSDGNPTPLDWSGMIGIAGNPVPSRPTDRFGVGYFRQSFSNALKRSLSPLILLRDEQGVEAFYTVGFAKFFRLTGNAQIIRPGLSGKSTAVVLGLRLKSDF